MSRSILARARDAFGPRPSVEVHIPISPTPTFLNMVRCLALSLRANGGICRDAPIILTVGDREVDPGLAARHPWLGPLGVEARWVPADLYREHEIYATGATRFEHEYRSDVVLFLDADILVAAPFDEMIRAVHSQGHLAGMIAQASPIQFFDPPLSWRDLYRQCGVDAEPELIHEHPGWPYYRSGDEAYRYGPAYFNYGVIAAPARVMKQIGRNYLADLTRLRELTSNALVAQIALTISIVRDSIPYRTLPVRYNYPNHPMLEALHGPELPLAKFLHLKETHQFEKFDLFADLANVRRTIGRTDLRNINEMARRVLEQIQPDLN